MAVMAPLDCLLDVLEFLGHHLRRGDARKMLFHVVAEPVIIQRRRLVEQLVQSEAAERSRRSLERRLRLSGIKGFKPMADFDWTWPTKIERDVIERALTLDFLQEGRNLVMVGTNGLGKTMIAQNIGHAAVMAGSSVLFRSAPALLEELHRQSPEGRRRKLRGCASVGLLCIDEVG